MDKAKLYLAAVVVLSILLGLSLATAVWSIDRQVKNNVDFPPPTRYAGGKCKGKGLVAHWNFDEVQGDVTPDQGPNGVAGRLEVAARPLAKVRYGTTPQVEGKIGKALEFKGKQWVSGGNNDCFATEQFTVAAWVWLAETASVPTIAAKSSWPSSGWWLCTTTKGIQKADRMLDFGISWGSAVTHVESGYQLPLREWHHVVASLDNEKHEAFFYVDGKLYGQKHSNVPNWLVNWDRDFLVGEYDGSARWPWVGKLDDVRVYNTVLSESEATALYEGSAHRAQL